LNRPWSIRDREPGRTQRTNASVETVNRATEVRLLAERQMGAFLKDMPKATGGWPKKSCGNESEPQDRPTFREIGTTKMPTFPRF